MAEQLETRPEPASASAQTDSSPGGAGWRLTDAILITGVALLLLFPIASKIVADALPIAPGAGPPLAPLAGHASTAVVRNLPEFVTLSPTRVAAVVAGGRAAETREVNALAREVYGPRGARTLERLLAGGSGRPPVPSRSSSRRPEENDLAAMLIVGGASSPYDPQAPAPAGFSGAGSFALELLQAAARSGACAPNLNLAFLHAADSGGPLANLVQRDYRSAVAACPGDPTPLWALGQFQSLLIGTSGGSAAPLATFTTLQERFPHLAAAWSGEGDVEMRIGYLLQAQPVPEPFTARQRFEQALALYRRAVTLSPGAGDLAGWARALAALGEFKAAVAVQRRAVKLDPTSAELQARLLDYLQRAHRFAQAAEVAGRLAAVHQFPSGSALFAEPPFTRFQASDEDAGDPLSTGVGMLKPFEISVTPVPPLLRSGLVNDLPFFPTYLPMGGVGGDARWCPQWSRLVDLLLAGHPAEVLRDFPGRIADLRPGAQDCDSDTLLLHGPRALATVAELELGHTTSATACAANRAFGPSRLTGPEDLRQNLWRYAGKLGRAQMAAVQWAQSCPGNEQAIAREGEIAFLQRRYGQAALDFSLLVDRARWQSGSGGETEAIALLDEGTALAYAGRHAEAIATLAAARNAAIRWNLTSGDNNDGYGPVLATYADEQAGNTMLERNQPEEAANDYAAAAEDQANINPQYEISDPTSVLRSDVLDNNQAIADIAIDDSSDAAGLATKAIQLDPGNAIYWWTEAQAQQQLGHRTAAIDDYRAALARDPTEFPAANDLGVLLLQRGDDRAAVEALRRSVGADQDYATGWFNLAVALGRLGPAHVFAAQGSMARVRKLDPGLASRVPEPFLDNAVYLTHLDLSKPLPPEWTFARSQTRTPIAAAGLSAILLVALSLARSLTSGSGRASAQQWLPLLARFSGRIPRTRALRSPVLGIAATAGFLLWPLHTGSTDGWTAAVAFAVGVMILIAVVVRVRQLTAAHVRTPLHQETWLPGIAVGLVLTLVGLGWAPLPVARVRVRGRASAAVHWAGPLAVATLAIALLLLAAWLDAPVTRSLGAAALVMAASLLTPVKPLDGATVTATKLGALPGVAVLGAAVLMVVGLL